MTSAIALFAFPFNYLVEGPVVGFAGREMRLKVKAEYVMTEPYHARMRDKNILVRT